MLALATLTIIGMQFYGKNQAIILMIILDLLVLAPTVKKIWINPDTEDKLAWIMASISHILVFFSLENITFTT